MFYQFAPRFPGPGHAVDETPLQICRVISHRINRPERFLESFFLMLSNPIRVRFIARTRAIARTGPSLGQGRTGNGEAKGRTETDEPLELFRHLGFVEREP